MGQLGRSWRSRAAIAAMRAACCLAQLLRDVAPHHPHREPRHYPHCNLGQVYWAQGLLAKAASEFERALEIEPGYPYARAALTAIRKQLN